MLHLLGGHMLAGPTLDGPWTYQGVFDVQLAGHDGPPEREFQYGANRSGMQREDDSFLFMSKFGRMMVADIMMGPYKIVTKRVNFGRGCKPLKTSKHERGLVIEFDAAGHGFTAANFAGKLIGRSAAGDLVIGFAQLPEGN